MEEAESATMEAAESGTMEEAESAAAEEAESATMEEAESAAVEAESYYEDDERAGRERAVKECYYGDDEAGQGHVDSGGHASEMNVIYV